MTAPSQLGQAALWSALLCATLAIALNMEGELSRVPVLIMGASLGGLIGCLFRRAAIGVLLGYAIACTLMLIQASMLIQEMM